MKSHNLRAASGSGSGVTDLPSFFGVNPSSSTTVRFEFLDQRYTGTSDEPGNGWNSFPKSATGIFISAVGLTAIDNLGIWKTPAYGSYALPSDVRWVNSVSGHSNTWSYNPYDLNTQHSTSGAFMSSSGTDLASSGVSNWFDLVFSNGLTNNAGASALGFVFQWYGDYGAGRTSYHNSALNRMICNGVSATFAPKGEITPNSTNSPGNDSGGTIQYPTLYDPTTSSAVDSAFGSASGSTLGQSYFVY